MDPLEAMLARMEANRRRIDEAAAKAERDLGDRQVVVLVSDFADHQVCTSQGGSCVRAQPCH